MTREYWSEDMNANERRGVLAAAVFIILFLLVASTAVYAAFLK
jgi:hypothetical protein